MVNVKITEVTILENEMLVCAFVVKELELYSYRMKFGIA